MASSYRRLLQLFIFQVAAKLDELKNGQKDPPIRLFSTFQLKKAEQLSEHTMTYTLVS